MNYYTNTTGLTMLINDSKGRNRDIHDIDLVEDLDPNGVHVVVYNMVHNDTEMRARWLIKLKGDMQPAIAWLDCDLGLWNRCVVSDKTQVS